MSGSRDLNSFIFSLPGGSNGVHMREERQGNSAPILCAPVTQAHFCVLDRLGVVPSWLHIIALAYTGKSTTSAPRGVPGGCSTPFVSASTLAHFSVLNRLGVVASWLHIMTLAHIENATTFAPPGVLRGSLHAPRKSSLRSLTAL